MKRGDLKHCDQTSGPKATSCQRLLVTKPSKPSLNVLLATKCPFVSINSKELKTSKFLSRLLIYVRMLHMQLTLKPYLKTQESQIIMSDTSCCRRKFRITRNYILICSHSNNNYIWACNIASFMNTLNIVKDYENWMLIFRSEQIVVINKKK